MSVSYRQYYLQGDEFLGAYDDADTVSRIFWGGDVEEGEGHGGDTPVEEHFLSVWPAPPHPDTVHCANDAFARTHYGPVRAPGQPIQP